jgi:hypothetical protein
MWFVHGMRAVTLLDIRACAERLRPVSLSGLEVR